MQVVRYNGHKMGVVKSSLLITLTMQGSGEVLNSFPICSCLCEQDCSRSFLDFSWSELQKVGRVLCLLAGIYFQFRWQEAVLAFLICWLIVFLSS